MDLYVFRPATTSRAVLAFCDAANLDVTIHDIDLMKGEHKQPSFLALNPNGLVPVLDDGGFVLSEASAILRYLAAKARSPLYPEALHARARVDERLAWLEANFLKDFGHQLVYPSFMPHHARSSDEGTRCAIEWGHAKSEQWLRVLDDAYLKDQRWLAGDELTIADFFGASIVSVGELIGFDLSGYRNVARWYGAITQHPSWLRINRPFEGVVAAMRGAVTAPARSRPCSRSLAPR